MQLFIKGKALESLVPESLARNFHLVRMNLTAAACPQPFSQRTANLAVRLPIVVIKNRDGFGRIEATGFQPRVLVAAGEQTRKNLMGRGIVRTWVWAEAGSLETHADDAISCEELSEKLQAALMVRVSPAGILAQNTAMPGLDCAWISKIYPFENCFIYRNRGQQFRQSYDLDPVERKVRLSAETTKVEEKFVDAAGMEGWPFPQTGMRKIPSVSRPGDLGISPPAVDSEIMLMVVRNWANIHEAVDGYVSATKTGLYKPLLPMFRPVSLTSDGKIMSVVTAAGIAPVDFFRWSCSQAMKKPGKAATMKCKSCNGDMDAATSCCKACGKEMDAAGVSRSAVQNHMHGILQGSAYGHKKTSPDGTRVYAHKSNGRTLHVDTAGGFKVMNATGKVLRKGSGAQQLRHHLASTAKKAT